ncbi:Protein of unknown function [Duganella sp. CF402]|jgi:hypothetical protein|uniref:DUF2970 domain-containing protein n=1 Tax=unclassified Duganella TaxID=2636909 RepID=UPI0008CC7760|nr:MULTISPECIES: DUF2970 domain-containing protein [unclassified Duganella]RZT03988.1 DUF2970 family protein [Duganella sp. BK701]SEM52325.1 Protein of unknown function [Duganella sp. CF402]
MSKKPGFLYSVKAVLWSFVGLRRKRDFDEDQQGMNPLHIIVAALLAVAVFIGLLITIVKLVVAK